MPRERFVTSVPGPVSLFRRLRGRPDSEHEMALNRVALGSGIFLYALAIDAPLVNLAVLACYTLIGIGVLIHIALDDSIRHWRRVFVIVLDVVALGHLIHANGAAGSAFIPLYMWLILGNGFRFGEHYLWIAVIASVTSFAVVWATTPFWRALPVLATGLTIGLIALPAYAGTLIRKLSAARAAAEEASQAKSYFLASVSHELRTPLTAIIGLGAHLAEAEGDAEDRAMAGTIVSAGRQLLGMINRLLDYSRFEAKGGVAEMRAFDLVRLLASVRDLMQHQAQEKGLRLNLHIAADAPTALIGDETHLRDILVNLVGNALKFTNEGSITIVAGVERDGAGDRLRLAVADTGIGIADEAQAHIFGSFRQADDTIIDRYGGTGLGLAICKQLVELMGGEIGVDSHPGRGSRFWFTARVERDADAAPLPAPESRLLLYSADPALADAIGRGVVRRDTREAMCAFFDPFDPPIFLIDLRLLADQGLDPDEWIDFAETVICGAVPIAIAEPGDVLPPRDRIERAAVMTIGRNPTAAALDAALTTAATLARGSGIRPAVAAIAYQPRRILVADDNAMNQKVFGMILGRAGHDVTCVDDGEQALDLMKDHGFDVVLMDVNMPVLNGIEATKLYRFAALGQKKRLPIVAVTADASTANAERCRDAGMDACVAKPIEAEPLLALIDALTAQAEAPAPRVPAFDPTGVVTPLFRAAADPEPAIDWSSLDELEELGGRDFVAELLTVYTADADTLMLAVRAAVAAADVEAFRLNTHALRSSAANVGALRVAELCLHDQRIGEPEFHARGADHADRLAAELDKVSAALAGWADRPSAVASGG